MLSRCVALGLFLATATISPAITWCHDYAIFRASQHVLGRGVDINNLGTTGLKSRLTALGYTLVALDRPGSNTRLEQGDVVIIGNNAEGQAEDHSGFVTDADGRIDHLVQMFGDSNRPYVPSQIDNLFDPRLNEKLVRKGWTINDLRTRKRMLDGKEVVNLYAPKTFLIYRRTRQLTDLVGVWTAPTQPTPVNPASRRPDFSVDFAKGIAKHGGTEITFSTIPTMIIVKEEVAVVLQLKNTVDDAFTEQRALIHFTGNFAKPKPLHGGIFADPTQFSVEASLCDPAKALVSFKTPTGQSIKDAPPFRGEIRFSWPAFLPSAVIEHREVLYKFPENIQFRQRFQRQEMKLADALKLKYPDMS